MNWAVEFTVTARREILKLDSSLRKQLEEDLYELSQVPLCGKQLHGRLAGVRSWRSGDYRILYGIQTTAAALIVYRVAHRREVYR